MDLDSKIKGAGFPLVIGGLCFVAILGLSSYDFYQRSQREVLEERAATVADANRDRVTSQEEWESVYRQLSIPYDSTNSAELTNYQLKDYLSRNGEE